jgi:putative ABC transport system ATP-binding protein
VSLLRLQGVTRTVELPDSEPLHILRGIDLEVEVGDHVSVVGRSGSGKSTLLNLLGLLDSPTSGSLEFDGVPLGKLSASERDRRRGTEVGFIFQQFNLLGGRTALENVMTPLLYAPGRQFWRRERLAAEMLDKVGLGNRLASMPEQLSGGEQQRVAIARALVRGPRLILADEPTGNLDSHTGRVILDLLRELSDAERATVIMVTHNMFAASYGDRTLELRDGQIVRDVASPRVASV